LPGHALGMDGAQFVEPAACGQDPGENLVGRLRDGGRGKQEKERNAKRSESHGVHGSRF